MKGRVQRDMAEAPSVRHRPFTVAPGQGMQADADGQQEFIVSRLSASGGTTAFEGSHPTLFHAVSWLRWRLGVRAD